MWGAAGASISQAAGRAGLGSQKVNFFFLNKIKE